MRGTVAKRLRRQARDETKENYKRDCIDYYTAKGEKFITVDCFRGRYQMLKGLYKIAKRLYSRKNMPKLQIRDVTNGTGGEERLDMPGMREFLDLSQG